MLVLGALQSCRGQCPCAFADTLSFLVLGRVIQALGLAPPRSVARHRTTCSTASARAALALTMIAGGCAGLFASARKCARQPVWLADHLLVVAAFGVVLALHTRRAPAKLIRRTAAPLAASAVASARAPGRRSALSPPRRFGEPCHRRPLHLLRRGASHSDERAGPTAFQLGQHFASMVLIVFAAGFSRRAWLIAGASVPSVIALHRAGWQPLLSVLPPRRPSCPSLPPSRCIARHGIDQLLGTAIRCIL